jgi:hypothetical protein
VGDTQGPTADPAAKGLAMPTEDHQLVYEVRRRHTAGHDHRPRRGPIPLTIVTPVAGPVSGYRYRWSDDYAPAVTLAITQQETDTQSNSTQHSRARLNNS